MYEQHQKFIEFAASRPLSKIKQWTATLSCPILHLNGTVSIKENAALIMKWYSTKLPNAPEILLQGYSCEKNRIGCVLKSVF